jgi:7,8-dihydroneopterin aldolase/epimerase/oxygenase
MAGKIILEGLEFHAYHGVYPHERESGNWFEVDIAVETDFRSGAETDELAGTVNYETIFRLIKEEMEKPSKLLETVAKNVIDSLFRNLPQITRADLKLSKLNPPIGGKCRKAAIHLSRQRSEHQG